MTGRKRSRKTRKKGEVKDVEESIISVKNWHEDSEDHLDGTSDGLYLLPKGTRHLQDDLPANNTGNSSDLGENVTAEADLSSTIYELETTFSGSNGNNGAMFDVSTGGGNHKIEVISLDLHTNLFEDDCPVLVFGRPGTHVGFENTTAGWIMLMNTTVECKGFGAHTKLPPFQNPPVIDGGGSYAFYTYMPTPNVRYINGQAVGAIYSSSAFLSIHEGTGVAGWFGGEDQNFLRPRVWNGVVKYLVDDANLPTGSVFDGGGCSGNATTTYADNLGSYGNMFDVLTLNSSIEIFGVDFYTDLIESVTYEIFTIEGTYASSMFVPAVNGGQDPNSEGLTNVANMQALNWTLVKRGTAIGRGSGRGTPVRNFVPFTVPPYSRQGFYVTLTQPDMRYRDITQDLPNARAGDTYQGNDDIEILIGHSVGTYPAQNLYYEPRLWSGAIVYTADHVCATDPPTEVPTNIPTPEPTEPRTLAPLPAFGNCTNVASLETTMEGGTGSYGNMFTVTAKARLAVTTVDMNIGSTDQIYVEVFTKEGTYKGFEEDPGAWTRVSATNVTGSGTGIGTSIPYQDFTAVNMLENQTWAFYVTLSTADIKYSRTSVELGDPFVSDDYISISAGAGLAAPDFGGSLFEPRAFNGKVYYRYEQECAHNISTTVLYNFIVQYAESKSEDEVVMVVDEIVLKTVQALQEMDPDLQEYGKTYHLDLGDVNTYSADAGCPSSLEIPQGTLCSALETQVIFNHQSTLDSGKVLFVMLKYKDTIASSLAAVTEFQAQYDGDVATQADVTISLNGNFTAALSDSEVNYFQAITRAFLNDMLHEAGVNVLNVAVRDHTLKDENGRKVRFLQRADDNGITTASSIDIAAMIDGSYRPPPEIDFSGVVEDAMDAEGGDQYRDDLQNGRRDIPQEIVKEVGSFQAVTSVAKVESKPVTFAPTIPPTLSPTIPAGDAGGGSNAGALGAVLGVLLIIFLGFVWWFYRRKNKVADHGQLVNMGGTLSQIKGGLFGKNKSFSMGLFSGDDTGVIDADCDFASDPYLQEQHPGEMDRMIPGDPSGFQDEFILPPMQGPGTNLQVGMNPMAMRSKSMSIMPGSLSPQRSRNSVLSDPGYMGGGPGRGMMRPGMAGEDFGRRFSLPNGMPPGGMPMDGMMPNGPRGGMMADGPRFGGGMMPNGPMAGMVSYGPPGSGGMIPNGGPRGGMIPNGNRMDGIPGGPPPEMNGMNPGPRGFGQRLQHERSLSSMGSIGERRSPGVSMLMQGRGMMGVSGRFSIDSGSQSLASAHAGSPYDPMMSAIPQRNTPSPSRAFSPAGAFAPVRAGTISPPSVHLTQSPLPMSGPPAPTRNRSPSQDEM